VSSTLRVDKKELDQLVSALVSRYRVFGPVDVDGTTVLREVKTADELALEAPALDGSAKAAFFPQTETLLYYDKGTAEAPPGKDKPTAVIGIRPCDARSLVMLDKVFSTGKYRDIPWQRHQDDNLVVGLGCGEPLETCFCHWLGSGPFSPEGSDVMLTDIGDAYIAESCTDKGERFLKAAFKSQMQRPSQADLDKAGQVRSRAQQSMGQVVDVSAVKPALAKLWDSPLWDEVALECLSCAACAYLCPTCHCFDVQDETIPGTTQGRRIRIWDTCMSALFTKEASGHNPRGAAKDRMRQRVMHKFSYFVDNFGETACVGCGRCIRLCPVNLDIRDVLKKVMTAEVPGQEPKVKSRKHAG
jgi:sulfhydrogenase subunit beta (sulfur reductase)